MSFIGLLKAAATGSKTAKLIKGAKGVFTILEVFDTVLDAGQLADEIARAIMGDNYSPELRDLAEEVAELGIELDTKMTAIAQANVDISNLSAGINSLAAIELDFGTRSLLVIEQLEKLDQLRASLSEASPTVQEWFATLRASAISNAPDVEQLATLKNLIGPDFAIIAANSGMLGLRAAYVGYMQYQKRKQAGDPPSVRPRADAFSGGDIDDLQQAQSSRAVRYSTLRGRAKTIGQYTFSGVTKLVTLGSFGMNIFIIVSKVKAFQEAMRELRALRDRYQKEIPLYEQALSGVPRNEAALQAFADFFELDISAQSTRESLHVGYNGTIQEYESLIVELLGQEDDLTTPDVDESDGIEGAYRSMIAKFEETQLVDSDFSTIESLQASYNQYQFFKTIALDTEKQTEVRKAEGFDPIRDEFVDSVSRELNTILSTLAVQIADHNSLNTLLIIARDLIGSAEEIEAVENEIAKTEAQLAQTEDPFIRELLEDKLALLLDKRDSLQPDIESNAQLALDLISVNTERSQFKTLPEVIAALEVLIEELSATAATAPTLVAA